MDSSHLIISTIVVLLATISQTAQLPPTLKPIVLSKEPTVRIQCLSGSMIITVKDPPPSHDGVFSGMIYPKGLSKNSTCLSEYRDHDGPLRYKLPLRSCNTMPQENDDGGIEFFNTIVVQPHLKLVTDLGRGYHVRCRYKSREAATVKYGKKASSTKTKTQQISATLTNPQALSSPDGVDSAAVDRRDYGRSLDLQKDNSVDEVPMPGSHMKIFSGGIVAENVKIGDPLNIMVYIDKQDIYGLHVTDCLVRDGLGWGEQKLINAEGCPMDGEIMGQFQYTPDRTNATVSFPAHKFPYTTSVYYQCNVRLCELKDAECKKSPDCSIKRTKRQSEVKKAGEEDDEGHPATIEVYSGLYVNENAEVIEGADDVLKEKTPEDAICVSQRNFAIAIAIAGLILMLAVIAAVLIIMSRRRGKAMSNSDSSIYSGPYTNTAFSHGS